MPLQSTTTLGRAGRVRVARLLALALALVLCAGAAGASAATSTTARLARIHKLTKAQFRAIERVYVASLPLDGLDAESAPSPAELQAAVLPPLRACLRLSTKDPLLRAVRAGCPATARLTKATASISGCQDIACLTKAVNATRSALRGAVSGSHTSDRAVNATHLASACKRALVTPPVGYVAYGKLDGALAQLQHALKTRSAADLDAAQAALNAADDDLNKLPSAKKSLALLRSGCR